MSEEDKAKERDPSTSPTRAIRQYKDDHVTVKIRGLEASNVRVHIEHKSGAALIVPYCTRRDGPKGIELETTGFDGTDYLLELDDTAGMIAIEASTPTPILGGVTRLVLARGEDIVPASGLRVTGDEDTMPIAVKKS